MKLTKQRLAKQPSIVLCVVPEHCGKRFRHYTRGGIPFEPKLIVPLVEYPPTGHRPFEFLCRIMDPYILEYHTFRSWLEKCDQTHGATCSAPKAVDVPVMRLSVIDCHAKRVVQISATEKYFALSYVWGKSSPELRFPQKLNSHFAKNLTKVVQDAMEVCNRLGGKYLWVDKYCIGNEDRDVVIKKMDQIYESAYATIISTGSSADCGIPGVSVARELPQPRIKTSGVRVALTAHVDPDQGVNYTDWNTRGWTYQEGVLSRRRLIFTQQKVYFQCHCGSACEDVHSSLGLEPSNVAKRHQVFFPPIRSTQKGDHLVFPRHLFRYTGRTLTDEYDVLDAFRGILTRSKEQTYYGVPLIGGRESDRLDSVEADRLTQNAFALGLSWANTHQEGDKYVFGRRPGFPSWSWTGWYGRKEYQLDDVLLSGFTAYSISPAVLISSDTEFWIVPKSLEGKEKLPSITYAAAQSAAVIPEQSRFLLVRGLVVKISFDPHPSSQGSHLRYRARFGKSKVWNPLANKDLSKRVVDFFAYDAKSRAFAQAYFSQEQEGLLLFWGQRAHYKSPDQNTCVVLLRDALQDGEYYMERVGVVWICSSEIPPHSAARKEFILG
jgi:hypothetical protein